MAERRAASGTAAVSAGREAIMSARIRHKNPPQESATRTRIRPRIRPWELGMPYAYPRFK